MEDIVCLSKCLCVFFPLFFCNGPFFVTLGTTTIRWPMWAWREGGPHARREIPNTTKQSRGEWVVTTFAWNTCKFVVVTLGTNGRATWRVEGTRGQIPLPNSIPLLLLELKNPKNPCKPPHGKHPTPSPWPPEKGHEKLIKTHLHHSSCLQHITLVS